MKSSRCNITFQKPKTVLLGQKTCMSCYIVLSQEKITMAISFCFRCCVCRKLCAQRPRTNSLSLQ